MSQYEKLLANVSKASITNGGFVKLGYGQVEPNHLSAPRNGKIYAQLPVAAPTAEEIEGDTVPAWKLTLENGEFVKYDYLNEEVNKTGAGEWMLVFNEIKLYRENQADCEFAMIRDNYVARIYSPYDGADLHVGNPMNYAGVFAPEDMYELKSTTNPDLHSWYKDNEGKKMKENTKMVPRVFKTDIGDIYTTNMIKALDANLTTGKLLVPGNDGVLAIKETPADGDMVWQVVKKYTMPDGQPGVKIMRIK